jgi:hypothetical protein
VAAGHLVAHGALSLRGDVDLGAVEGLMMLIRSKGE